MSKVQVTSKQVAEVFSQLGFTLEEKSLTAITEYLLMVLKWNKVMNLVGPYSWQEIVRLLLVDSLHLAGFLESLEVTDSPRCWDFGAGAGLPGIPLRAVWREGQYYLVEVREKRTMFMEQVLARTAFSNTQVYRGRVEEFMNCHEPADIILSRAFMPWRKMLDLVQGHLAPQGRIIFLTLEPLPADMPEGWKAEREYVYEVQGKKRYFWSIVPISAPS